MTTQDSKGLDLAKDSIPKLFINYFFPMLFAMLAMASYSTVDGIFVNKKLGDDAMKAIVAVWPLFPIFMACSLMFSLGGASMIGYYLAKQKKQLARTIFSSIVSLLLPLFICIGLIMYCYAQEIIQHFIKNLSYNVEIMAIEYLKGISLGLFGIILQPILDICVVNDKRPKLAMSAMFLGAICNVILNYLFLFVWDFGIIGSAYATTLAHIIASCLLIWHYIRQEWRVRFFKCFGNTIFIFIQNKLSFLLHKKGDLYFIPIINWRFITRAMKLGSPYAASEASVGFIMWFYNKTLKDIGGENSLAIYSAILYAGFNFFTILLALAESQQPLASFNYGIRNFERLKKLLIFYISVELIVSACVYAIFFIFDKQIAAMFLKNLDLKIQSAEAMRIYFIGFIFLGINLIVALYLQSLQRAFSSFIITLSYTLIFVVILLPIFTHIYGLYGAWLTYPISQICALCVTLLVLYCEINRGIYKKS